MTADVVLVGLDGADRTQVARLADEGRLPVIASLRAQGQWGVLDAFDPLGDDAAWSSFATGVGPGHHGRRYFARYRPGTYDWVMASRDDIVREPFWATLATRGHRFAVLDVPKAPIGAHAENLVIADWMSHGAHEPRAISSPPRTWHEPLNRWLDGDETTWDCHHPGSKDDFVASLRRRAALRTDFALDVLPRADWDAMVVVFAETHCAGHFMWDEFERVEAVYRAVDEQLGRLIDAVGPEGTVIVFSLLGMGPQRSTRQIADAVLARLELPSPHAAIGWKPRALAGVRARTPRALRARIPARVRRMVSPSRDRDRDRDRGQQRFWRVPTDLAQTPIRCNVIGREPNGRVEPGAEFDALCGELREEFLALVEPATGRRIVQDVLVASDRYAGDAPDDFADLFVVWDLTQELTAASSPRIGDVHVVPVPSRPGEHCDGGWFVASGPGITHGVLAERASVLDLAPTVARLVGAPFDGEGAAIPGVVRPGTDQAAVGSMLNADQSSA